MADTGSPSPETRLEDVLHRAAVLLSSATDLDPAGASDAELAERTAAYRASIAAVARALEARGGDAGVDAAAAGANASEPVPEADRQPQPADGGGQVGAPHRSSPTVPPPVESAPPAQQAADAAAEAVNPTADTGAAAAPPAAAPPAADPSEWRVPPHSVPIHANVTTFDWPALAAAAQFDAVLMDPPWRLAAANPTRGVALGYSQLDDASIAALPVPALQRGGGLLFVWVINAKYKFTLDLFDSWGYE
jgi:hypothetical protein